MERWEVDPLLTEIHDALYKLGVKAKIQGFFETSCAIFLVMQQPDRSWFSIMELYQKICILYHVPSDVIDPRIRHVIQIAWKRNPALLSRMAGRRLEQRPTPREFIEIMRSFLAPRSEASPDAASERWQCSPDFGALPYNPNEKSP